MKVRTKSDASIHSFRGSMLRSGGQMVRNTEFQFRKGLTSSVSGEEEEQSQGQLKEQMSMKDWKAFTKLPSWQQRRFLRKMDRRVEHATEAAMKVPEENARNAQNTAGQIQVHEGISYATAPEGDIPSFFQKDMKKVPGATAGGQTEQRMTVTAGMQTQNAAVVTAGEKPGAAVASQAAAQTAGGAKTAATTATVSNGAVQGAAMSKGAASAAASSAGPYAAAAVAAATVAKKTAEEIKEALAGTVAAGKEAAKQELLAASAASGASGQSGSPVSGSGEGDRNGSAFALLVVAAILPFVTAMLPVLVALVLVSLLSAAELPQEPPSSIVAAAYEELDDQAGVAGGYKYKQWYGMDADWCAMFVSYCANECGYLESGIMPRSASVAYCLQWYVQRSRFHGEEDYIPKAGDIIFFGNGMSHTGIVVAYDPETEVVTTIEGNAGISTTTPYHAGSSVVECTYRRNYVHITGYASPDYPPDEEASTEEGDTQTTGGTEEEEQNGDEDDEHTD